MISLRLKVEEKDLTGKIAIVTGANTGIGLETARMLAQMHAHVILACRNEEKGALAAADIVETTGNKGVESWPLDLSSFASIHAFAERFGKEHEKLDLLINNAGLVVMEKAITGDGIEMTEPPLSSPAYEPPPSAAPAGGVPARDQCLVGRPLRRCDQLRQPAVREARIVPSAQSLQRHQAHEHFVHRRAGQEGAGNYHARTASRVCEIRVATLAARDCVQGAMTTVHCAVSDKAGASNAKYWDSCRQVEPKAVAHDRDVAKRLWEISEELAGLTNAPEGGERA
ncbi:hypothetical protein BC936DRAFT_145385 [Jimgerdemannia flammicorona]|uniref:Uncharacterized protein n=1 Tax=Jimgerdemannia flammicorona TaxID=994334 RepID=A0A433DAK8_9FUNG|nr:hypothetical protein BC936DRAFT_145385 [Jimgerdemannia flammicorona]